MKSISSLIAVGTLLALAGCGGGNGGGSGSSTPTSASNTAPIASAGSTQSLIAGSAVTLDGSNSTDVNHDTLTYNWSLTSKPTGSTATLSSSTAVRPTFTADLPVTYTATLTVNDGQATSNAVTVTITASQSNAAPVANAGSNQNVVTNNTVTLDGSTSSDATLMASPNSPTRGHPKFPQAAP